VKGAFTGAVYPKKGMFDLADKGSIFFDEIGNVPLETQAKLLRVIQERDFMRLGGMETIKVDVRIIAATNRDLLKCVQAGTFREDLYYRLNVFPITLPPLRERREDIPLLVQFLLTQFRMRLGKRIDGVSAATLRRLSEYAWPGNVREMENILERAAILATGPIIEIDADVLQTVSPRDDSPVSLTSAEREHILSALKKSRWVIDGPSGAAQILQIHPNTLRSRLKKLGITRPTHEAS
jgi:transcriptional regulator with GAF, ATPase, and Fis domain